MSISTLTAGYPVHRVTEWSRWTNGHGAAFTDYRAACGHTDTITTTFGRAGSARQAELCTPCFPRGLKAGYPEARQVERLADSVLPEGGAQ
jgi:hypothetical protein